MRWFPELTQDRHLSHYIDNTLKQNLLRTFTHWGDFSFIRNNFWWDGFGLKYVTPCNCFLFSWSSDIDLEYWLMEISLLKLTTSCISRQYSSHHYLFLKGLLNHHSLALVYVLIWCHCTSPLKVMSSMYYSLINWVAVHQNMEDYVSP